MRPEAREQLLAAAAGPLREFADPHGAVGPHQGAPCPEDLGRRPACALHAAEDRRVDQCEPIRPRRRRLEPFDQLSVSAEHVLRADDAIRQLVHREAEEEVGAYGREVDLHA